MLLRQRGRKRSTQTQIVAPDQHRLGNTSLSVTRIGLPTCQHGNLAGTGKERKTVWSLLPPDSVEELLATPIQLPGDPATAG
jgi:hypothetical protein